MIQPLGNFLLVEPIEVTTERETTTESGIILTSVKENRVETQVAKAKIIEVGDEAKKVKKGDVVYYSFFAGNSIIIPGVDPQGKDDKEIHLVWENDILAKEK